MKLTIKELNKMGACRAGMRKFRELFGDVMNVNMTNARKLAVWGTVGSKGDPPIRRVRVERAECGLLEWFCGEKQSETELRALSVSEYDWYSRKEDRMNRLRELLAEQYDEVPVVNKKYLDKMAVIFIQVFKRSRKDKLLG